MDDSDLTAEVDLSLGHRNGRGVDLHDPGERQRIEAALLEIPGVVATRIVPGYERPVDELHVVATVDRHPKSTVRDVQSVLLARFGINIDHRVVSVVQLDSPESLALGPSRRVTIRRVAVTQQGLGVRVLVTIDHGDQALEGEADGPASNAGRRRAVARATLEAIRSLLPEDQVVEIEGVEVAPVLGHEVALCFVHFHTVSGERTNCGSALVRGDESDAVARSVLDAVNRAIDEAG